MQRLKLDKLVLAGGVAANSGLRQHLRTLCQQHGWELLYPPPVLCTDNAAMIACRAHYQYAGGGPLADLHLNAVPSLPLGTVE